MVKSTECKTVIFISYGSGVHEQEIVCSIWSAIHLNKDDSQFDILVYTDQPASFQNLPKTNVVQISPETWREWAGPHHFNHRKKILALKHAIGIRQGTVVLVDGDTWFRRPIATLFERIGPGRSVMHIREGNIGTIEGPRTAELRNLLDRTDVTLFSGERASLTSNLDMWNAGVVGLHYADRSLLDDVVAITDQLCTKSNLHVLEQFAFSWVFSQKTRLSEAADIVFHYWPPYLHKPFRARVQGLLQQANGLPESQKAAFLYKHRPQPSTLRRGKVIVKRCAQALGLIQGRARTNEW